MKIPTWIRDMEAKDQTIQRDQREIRMAESLLRSETPKLWEQFIGEMAIQVEACKHLSRVRNPRFDNFTQANPPDYACAVTLSGNTPFGKMLTTTVRLKTDLSVPYIECLRDSADHGKDYRIYFRLNGLGEVVMVIDGDVTPQMAAEHVLKVMISDMEKPF